MLRFLEFIHFFFLVLSLFKEQDSIKFNQCYKNSFRNLLIIIFHYVYIINITGEVVLHRLTWQKVLLLSPQDESDTIAHLAWRPDGKLLGVCYENSKLLFLIDVETKNVIHKTKMPTTDLTVCIKWLLLPNIGCDSSSTIDKTDISPTGDYLPPLPTLNRTFNQEPERKEFLTHTLDMLYVCITKGDLFIIISSL